MSILDFYMHDVGQMSCLNAYIELYLLTHLLQSLENDSLRLIHYRGLKVSLLVLIRFQLRFIDAKIFLILVWRRLLHLTISDRA